jgi:hypothetical protein
MLNLSLGLLHETATMGYDGPDGLSNVAAMTFRLRPFEYQQIRSGLSILRAPAGPGFVSGPGPISVPGPGPESVADSGVISDSPFSSDFGVDLGLFSEPVPCAASSAASCPGSDSGSGSDSDSDPVSISTTGTDSASLP